MDYLTIKTVHVLSMVLLFGVGLGSAFYKWTADKSANVIHIAHTNRQVVRADWLFTTPTILLQPVSGLWMAHTAGWSLEAPWLLASLALFVIAGACWLPVVWLQIRMRHMADVAAASHTDLPDAYWALARYWFWLGVPAFVAMVLVVCLMVIKHVPVAGL